MNQLPLPKPKRKEKVQRFGVYRKNLKPKKFKKVIEEKEVEVWTGHPLLEPPYQGHYLYEVTDELYEQVFERSNGKCENPDCDNIGQEVNHIVGHSRRAHLENLNLLCINCHRTGKDAFHNFGKFYKYCMKKYQEWCFNAGFSADQVKFLLAKKDKRLF